MREFRGKHIAAMRAMLAVAFNDGAILGAAWGPVLVCVSSLARLVNISQGGKEDAHFFAAPPGQRERELAAREQALREAPNPAAARREAERVRQALDRDVRTEQLNAALVGAHVREADLTRLYTRSVQLPSSAIVDFVTQLAAVSIQELSGVVSPVVDFPAIGGGSAQRHDRGLQPRVFSLQKVVEVADFNMAVRPRMAWARIWDQLSRYFTAVCCSSNTGVAMFAIDSLKQLAVKFMAKPELKSFSFQGKFLYPFLAIMEATSPAALAQARAQAKKGGAAGGAGGALVAGAPTFLQPAPDIRELILHVCANIIHARHANTRSGWRSLMGVYAAAATDTSEVLVSQAFSTAHEVLSEQHAHARGAGAPRLATSDPAPLTRCALRPLAPPASSSPPFLPRSVALRGAGRGGRLCGRCQVHGGLRLERAHALRAARRRPPHDLGRAPGARPRAAGRRGARAAQQRPRRGGRRARLAGDGAGAEQRCQGGARRGRRRRGWR